MRHTVITVAGLILLTLAVSCKQSQSNKSVNTAQDIDCEENLDTSSIVQLEGPLDSVYYSGPYKIARYFGSEDVFQEEGKAPDIPGLAFHQAYGYHLGVRCPSDKVIRNWASKRLKRFADWCKVVPSDTIPSIVPLYENPNDAEDLCLHYMKIVADTTDADLNPCGLDVIEQHAELLIDIYDGKRYCTMQEATWYDYGSCGDQTTRSWFTIDKKTGKELELKDIVHDRNLQEFSMAMLKHLNAYGYPWYYTERELKDSDVPKFLDDMDGIALVPEGVIVYFHPYNIGSGAEGQYNALIPYGELKGMLKVSLE